MQIMRNLREDQGSASEDKTEVTPDPQVEASPRISEPARAAGDNAGLTAIFEALGRSQAMIEFQLDGTIVTANENFLTTMGYGLAEIQGNPIAKSSS